MPVATVVKNDLFAKIGVEFTDEEFDDLCFEFGLELEESLESCPNHNGQAVFSVEVPSNRSDLLCVEGIARALKCHLGLSGPPRFSLSTGSVVIKAKKECSAIRPFVFGAVLRNVRFTPNCYKSFIDLQNNLHKNLGRERTLVAIGTHDLDTLEAPLSYEALPPTDIVFKALGLDSEMNAKEILQIFESHVQLKYYLHIIRDSPVYPIIFDRNRVVLSMPPIINSEHTKLTLSTRNVFIDVTATEYVLGETAVRLLVSMFSEYCEEPFRIEPVTVEYEEGHRELGGQSFSYPDISGHSITVDVARCSRQSGIRDLTSHHLQQLLARQMMDAHALNTKPGEETEILKVNAPFGRSDIMSEDDIAEAALLSYGVNKIPNASFTLPPCSDVKESVGSRLSQLLVGVGYHEVINWKLCRADEAYQMLRRTPIRAIKTEGNQGQAPPLKWDNIGEYAPTRRPAQVENSKTVDFEVIRPTLVPGLLKALLANQAMPEPIKLFETGDVVLEDNSADLGVRNVPHCGVLCAGHAPSAEEMRGILIQMLQAAGITEERGESNRSDDTKQFKCVPFVDEDLFLDGARVRLLPDDLDIGVVGTVHPIVLQNFSVRIPVLLMELNLNRLGV